MTHDGGEEMTVATAAAKHKFNVDGETGSALPSLSRPRLSAAVRNSAPPSPTLAVQPLSLPPSPFIQPLLPPVRPKP